MNSDIPIHDLMVAAEVGGFLHSLRVSIYRSQPPDLNKFYELVDLSLEWAAGEMSNSAQSYSKQSEDQITISLVGQLKAMGLEVSNEERVGGHCDIVIKDRAQVRWIGEAKLIAKANNHHLYGGLSQLLMKYTPGTPGTLRAGLLIYCTAKRADIIVNSWFEYLSERAGLVEIKREKPERLGFVSRHRHVRTGHEIDVGHIAFPFHFDPKDKLPGLEDA